jgi:pilus assembly protein CpaB
MSIRAAVVSLMLLTVLVVGLFVYQLGNRTSAPFMAPPPPPPPVLVSYLVAARPLPPGTLARIEDFTVKSVPTQQVPPGAIIDTPDVRAELRTALIRRYIEAGTAPTMGDLLRPRERGFLAAVLAPNARAITIGVDPVSGVAGLIWPGDHVDMILTQDIPDKSGSGGRLITAETVMSNMLVLAVDQNIAQGAISNGNAAGKIGNTVTLQAAADEAERIAVAGRLGKITLAVRSERDARPEDTGLGAAVASTDVSPALAHALAATPPHMQIIQGGQSGEVTFK